MAAMSAPPKCHRRIDVIFTSHGSLIAKLGFVLSRGSPRGRGPSIGGRLQSAQLGPCARIAPASGARHRSSGSQDTRFRSSLRKRGPSPRPWIPAISAFTRVFDALSAGMSGVNGARGWTSRGGDGMNAPPIPVLGHEAMKTFFLRFFTWWNGATFGTLLWTSLYGEPVGEDEFGNRYYRTRGGKIDPTLGYERRWVIYNGTAEASIVPPSWHGWLHHTVDTPPTQEKVM